jgi:hypothetical protein
MPEILQHFSFLFRSSVEEGVFKAMQSVGTEKARSISALSDLGDMSAQDGREASKH